jgi:hypothetical protein
MNFFRTFHLYLQRYTYHKNTKYSCLQLAIYILLIFKAVESWCTPRLFLVGSSSAPREVLVHSSWSLRPTFLEPSCKLPAVLVSLSQS